jgi:hypothetical protein
VKIDIGEFFGSGPGLVLRQLLLFALAVYLGCSLAACSLIAARLARAYDRFEPEDLLILPQSPALLLSLWLPLNLLFLPILLWRVVFCSDSIGYRTWCLLIGGEALFAMAGVGFDIKDWPLTLAWFCCLMLIALACAALWYVHQWRLKRWAAELMALEIENAERRRELKEEFGMESAGFKESGPP